MDHTEEMVALKKVYAEMILNTSKEAAVRVMAAESKAHNCEKELISTKEEAIRMLLRLKHTIDSQKKEAEATSLNDQKRINELEAQLDEAEGVIIDLRVKLNHVEDQLESMKDKYKRSLSRKEIVYLPNHNKTPMDTQSYFLPPYLLSVPEPSPVFPEVPVSIPTPRTSLEDIAITIESKEPEVFDNECCQRVETISLQKPSACDHECITSSKEIIKSSISVSVSASASATIESNETYKKIECIEKSLAIETCLPEDKMQIAVETRCVPKSDPEPKKKRINAKVKSLSCTKESFVRHAVKEQPLKFNKLLRRSIRYGRVIAASSKFKSAKIVMPQRTRVAFSRCKSTVSGNTRKSDNAPQKIESGLNLKKYDAVSDVRRSLRKRKMELWDTLEKASSLNENFVEFQALACQNVQKVEGENKTHDVIHSKKAFSNVENEESSKSGVSFLEDDVNLIDIVITEQPIGLVPLTHEGIHVKEACLNVDTLAKHDGNSLEDDVNLIDVLIVEQPNEVASNPKLDNTCSVSMTDEGIHVKESFVNAETVAERDEDDDNLIDVVIVEQPSEVASHLKLEKRCDIPVTRQRGGFHVKEAFVNEDDDKLIEVVIVEQVNGVDSHMKSLKNTFTVPVDLKLSEPNTNRTIIHTFSRKRKKRSLINLPDEECSPNKRYAEGNDIILRSGNN